MRKTSHTQRWVIGLSVIALAIVSLAPAGFAASGAQSEEAPALQGDQLDDRNKDNRQGRVAPTARQRTEAAAAGARATWNNLGTPASLTVADEPLADGLSADAATAANEFVAGNLDLLGLEASGAEALELLTVAPMGEGAAVIMRQRFGDLEAGHDGMLVVGVRDGAVWHVSSSLARSGEAPAPATLSADEAEAIALADAGVTGTVVRNELVAVPTPDRGARAAYHIELIDNGALPVAYATFVDARDGGILVRQDLVDWEQDNPVWEVFPGSPATDYSSNDTRATWCWTPIAGCDEVVGTPASPLPWDVNPATGLSTTTTNGNNSIAVHNWFSNDPFSVGTETATASPSRDYKYAWTNQWYEQRCDPATFTSPQSADIDAARANLFGMHNRMHDWSYHLGFTEATWNMQRDNFGLGGLGNDPEQGNAQAGGVSGGPPGFAARDNANQITGADGVAPITNMYMWQPIAATFYAPCVDGDYDMSVIAHEYGHAITNRMIAGPNAGVNTPQGMSESWSDLIALAYLTEHGYTPHGDRASVVGEYVTGDSVAGIRNYNMAKSPLNYSHIDYDFVGLQVHASGEVWSATNYDIRNALIQRYGTGNPANRKACANGGLPVTSCGGGRRWSQIMFDSFLLMAVSQNSMVQARDAMLAADNIRFGGANQDLLWNAFAKRGLGQGASSSGAGDTQPVPSFSSPHADEATVTFKPTGSNGAAIPNAQLFVGPYQARAFAMADTDAATAATDTFQIVPGHYEFIVVAPGYGHVRVNGESFAAGEVRDLVVPMRVNLASAASGATATGDGINLARLIDDSEATNWASLGSPVAGKQVTVDLAGGAHVVRRVNVSAQLRPPLAGDPDAGTQNRFTALRSFRVLACDATAGLDCTNSANFTVIHTSAPDAFPSVAPRPRVPELALKQFSVTPTRATHLRLEVVATQCTGAPDYAGDQDDDPLNVTDCTTGSAQALNVRASEFQVFG